uniref:Uncharacterized protein n=1 Tax=Oryza brachyantha TaxID=4533 RepID=J3MB91_ORYBR
MPRLALLIHADGRSASTFHVNMAVRSVESAHTARFSCPLAAHTYREESGFYVPFLTLIVLLFYFLRRFEHSGQPAERARIKAVVWLLTAKFAARLAPLMPPLVAAPRLGHGRVRHRAALPFSSEVRACGPRPD